MSCEIAEGVLIEACKITKLSPETLRSRNRAPAVSRPRQACAYVIRRRSDWPTTKIARFLGLKDHSTVIHACNKIAKLIECDPKVKGLVKELMQAEPKVPLSSQHLGSEVKFVAPAPTRTQIKRAAVKIPPRKKPVREVLFADGRAFTVDERGDCRAGRIMRLNMMNGSAKLAKAIVAARGAAA